MGEAGGSAAGSVRLAAPCTQAALRSCHNFAITLLPPGNC
jgi:hypothetical protein